MKTRTRSCAVNWANSTQTWNRQRVVFTYIIIENWVKWVEGKKEHHQITATHYWTERFHKTIKYRITCIYTHQYLATELDILDENSHLQSSVKYWDLQWSVNKQMIFLKDFLKGKGWKNEGQDEPSLPEAKSAFALTVTLVRNSSRFPTKIWVCCWMNCSQLNFRCRSTSFLESM